MGAAHGWERPNWFRTQPGDVTTPSFRHSNWFKTVAQECHCVSNRAGLADLSVFSKFEITGPETFDFLNTLGANRPSQVGRISLAHVLSPAGGTAVEFTVSRLAPDHAYLTSAAAAEEMDEDLLRAHAEFYDIAVTKASDNIGILALMGPSSRAILADLTDADLDTGFPWLSVLNISVAGLSVWALWISYVGELGWELHVSAQDMPASFDALEQAESMHQMGYFGA